MTTKIYPCRYLEAYFRMQWAGSGEPRASPQSHGYMYCNFLRSKRLAYYLLLSHFLFVWCGGMVGVGVGVCST